MTIDETLISEPPVLSVVVPVFNEEESLPEFHRRMLAVLDDLDVLAELIYIDDGSRDLSAAMLADLSRSDPRVLFASLPGTSVIRSRSRRDSTAPAVTPSSSSTVTCKIHQS